MPKESDATSYRRMFVSLMREIHKLRADHDALMQIFGLASIWWTSVG